MSDEFARQLQQPERASLLTRRTVQRTETKMMPEEPASYSHGLASLGNLFAPSTPPTPRQRLADLLTRYPAPQTPLSMPLSTARRMVPTNVTVNQPDGQYVKLIDAYHALKLPVVTLWGG